MLNRDSFGSEKQILQEQDEYRVCVSSSEPRLAVDWREGHLFRFTYLFVRIHVVKAQQT